MQAAEKRWQPDQRQNGGYCDSEPVGNEQHSVGGRIDVMKAGDLLMPRDPLDDGRPRVEGPSEPKTVTDPKVSSSAVVHQSEGIQVRITDRSFNRISA